MKRTTLGRYLLALAIPVLCAGTSVQAANSLYAAGDLVMFFQEQGGSNTLYVNLGNAHSYRGAASGLDGASIPSVMNINSSLVSAFGSGWASNTSIYAGLAGVRSASTTASTVINGDPARTVYVSSARDNLGAANSIGYVVSNLTSLTSAASNIGSMLQPFGSAGTSNTLQLVSPTSTSNIDNQNPFLAQDVPGTAFNTFAGGVSQRGTAGNLGSLNGVNNVEFALDLQRILARNDLANTVSGPVLSSTFEGTFLLGNDGNVSFAVIPEPSSAILSGLAGTLLLLRRRRNP
jgi:hypothetical protein